MSTKIKLIVLSIAATNLLAFAVGVVVLGGDANNGYSEDGTYYLGNHGRYTKVSRLIFNYSYYHAVSVWLTTPTAMIVYAVVGLKNNLPKSSEHRRHLKA